MLSNLFNAALFFLSCVDPQICNFSSDPIHSLVHSYNNFGKLFIFYTAYKFSGFNSKNELHLTEIRQS